MRLFTAVKFTPSEQNVMLDMLKVLSNMNEPAAKDHELSQKVATAFVAVSELFRSDPECELLYKKQGW